MQTTVSCYFSVCLKLRTSTSAASLLYSDLCSVIIIYNLCDGIYTTESITVTSNTNSVRDSTRLPYCRLIRVIQWLDSCGSVTSGCHGVLTRDVLMCVCIHTTCSPCIFIHHTHHVSTATTPPPEIPPPINQ